MKEFLEKNRELWEELTRIHTEKSHYYDLDKFKAGGLTLRKLEREEVGDVSGKSLLHLQCHFGLDTLSWARLGAKVTGVDFSEKSIALAQQLAQEVNLDARFIRADIYDLPSILDEQFDIVFTSYGTTVWLPDLPKWAQIIARSLKPGGMFYIVDGHPFSMCLSNEDDPAVIKVVKPYFHSAEPKKMDPDFDYAVPTAKVTLPSYEWTHSLADIVTSLASAGLQLVFLHEFPFVEGRYFQDMEQDEDGWWRLKREDLRIPHTYSIKAIRPRGG
jgi:SAM-dependent methyltransferase